VSVEQGRYFGKHLVHDFARNAFQFSAASRREIESPRLVAPDDSDGLGSGPGQRHGKTGGAGKAAPARYGKDDRDFRDPIARLPATR